MLRHRPARRQGANFAENTMPPMCSDSHGTPHAVCFEPGAMVRDMGNRIWEGQSPTLRANMGDNQPAVCYQDKIGALQARDYKGVGSQHVDEGKVICYPNVVGTLAASGAGTSRTAGQCNEADMCVVEKLPCMGNGGHVTGTIQASCSTKQFLGNQEAFSGSYHVVDKAKPPRKYIVRRLTPTECARLQGFPDCWGRPAAYDGNDAFWEQVRKTHAEINGKAYKPTKNIKTWYDKLHTDSSEYKMWGNGIALPCAEFVLRGIKTYADI